MSCKEITLVSLALEHFKGCKGRTFTFDGKDSTVIAENRKGKTTIPDGFQWLFFGKNSEGKSAFGVRPVDGDKVPIEGLTTSVTGILDIDSVRVTLKKTNVEKLIRKKVTGFESSYEINGVPKLKKEFDEYVSELMEYESFRTLTDLNYFNGVLKWTDRRKRLVGLAGDIPTPEGHGNLKKEISDKSIEDYTKILKKLINDPRIGYKKKQSDIKTRIDEVQKGSEDYTSTEVDQKELEDKTKILKEQAVSSVEALDEERKEISDSEVERQNKIDLVNGLKEKKIIREGELLSDTSNITDLLEEKTQLESDLFEVESAVRLAGINLDTHTSDRVGYSKQLQRMIVDYNAAKDTVIDDTCPTCQQKWPDGNIKDKEKVHFDGLVEMRKAANAKKSEVTKSKELIAVAENKLVDLRSQLEEATKIRDTSIAEIDKKISSKEKPKPETDSLWQTYDLKIKEIEVSIGESISGRLEAIDSERNKLTNKLSEYDKVLAQSEAMVKANARVIELGESEKEIAQKIADVEKALDEIDEYTKEESKLIEEAVNSKFDYVEFKLFKDRLNGGIEPDCLCYLDGVSHGDMSKGEEIFAGIDIVNTFSKHYGMSVVLFADNAENFTETAFPPIKLKSQMIWLRAREGQKTLLVEQK